MIYSNSYSISFRTTQSPTPNRILSIIQFLANPTIPTTINQPPPVEEILPTTANPNTAGWFSVVPHEWPFERWCPRYSPSRPAFHPTSLAQISPRPGIVILSPRR